MSEIIFKEKPLWTLEEPIVLNPEETQTFSLPSSIKTAAKFLTLQQEVLKNGATEYQFEVKSSINCIIEYKSEKLTNENYMILFNRDIEENDGYFTNTTTLNLQGNDVEKITLQITNNSTSELLEIVNMSIFESDDVQVTTIAKVLKEETISADLIQATSVMTEALFTQILETNALSRSVRRARVGDTVDYIRAEGYTMGFYTAVLGSEQEQFKIETEVAGTVNEYVYWYSQIEGEDAYKYLSTIDPREKYPDITDSNREKFAFMVYKPVGIAKKLSIEFALDENGNMTPSIILGAGIGAENSQAGKGFIYKNTNGFYHIYCQADGEKIGIVMDEEGVHITGWADQHCEEIIFKDNGVKLKFVGEDYHTYEYVLDNNNKLTGILQDNAYLTSISYEAGNL